MAIIGTYDMIKNSHINSHSPVKVKFDDVKPYSNLFGVLKKYIKGKTIREQYKIYTIKSKLNTISWIEN